MKETGVVDESIKDEISAIATIHAVLNPLSPSVRARVVRYVLQMLDIAGLDSVSRVPAADIQPTARPSGSVAAAAATFTEFSELFDAVGPETDVERALVAAYWLQSFQGVDGFSAQSVTKELLNLGHRLSNITRTLTDLKEQKPALVLQLKKHGTSQQARKTYKVSLAGSKWIEARLRAL